MAPSYQSSKILASPGASPSACHSTNAPCARAHSERTWPKNDGLVGATPVNLSCTSIRLAAKSCRICGTSGGITSWDGPSHQNILLSHPSLSFAQFHSFNFRVGVSCAESPQRNHHVFFSLTSVLAPLISLHGTFCEPRLQCRCFAIFPPLKYDHHLSITDHQVWTLLAEWSQHQCSWQCWDRQLPIAYLCPQSFSPVFRQHIFQYRRTPSKRLEWQIDGNGQSRFRWRSSVVFPSECAQVRCEMFSTREFMGACSTKTNLDPDDAIADFPSKIGTAQQ